MPINTTTSTLTLAGITVPTSDIQLIVAEKGISLDGGDMIIWKRNVIVTPKRRIVIKKELAYVFRQVIDQCPHAVAIDADGFVTLPRITPGTNEDPLNILQIALASAKREYGRQIIKIFAFALLFFVIVVGLIILIVAAIAADPKQAGIAQVGIYGIIVLAAAIFFATRGFLLLSRRSRLCRVLGDLITKGDLNTPVLATILSPPPAPPTPSLVCTFTATLAILAAIVMFCPFVGMGMSAIALACTFRHSTWTRTLAIIALVVSTLMTAFALFMANR